MKAILILIVSVLTLCTSCEGQITSPVQLGSTVTELDDSIWYILQDKNKNFWFGSNGHGVYYFDGNTLLNLTSKDGLLSDEIRGIQEDSLGNIFIASLGGINKFDGKELTPLVPIESDEWELDANDLWFSILGKKNENGVYRYDGTTLHHLKFPKHYLEDEFFSNYPNPAFSPYEVYSTYKDRDGHMWFGTANLGVCRYDGKALSWLYEDHLSNTPSGGSFGIRSIFEDKDGLFWFCNTRNSYAISATYTAKDGTNLIDYERKNGMGKLAAETTDDFPYFFSITDDHTGALWMVTYDQGVLKFKENKLTQYPIIENDTIVNLYTIYKDKENNLWLGTHNAGVYKFNGTAFEKFKPFG